MEMEWVQMMNGEIERKRERFTAQKWTSLVAFGVLYFTVYYGRFSMLYCVEDIRKIYVFSENLDIYLSCAMLLSYAVGSFFMGRIADIVQRPIFFSTLGAGISLLANVSIIFIHTQAQLIFLGVLNGLFQSMIWVNGIQILVMWWKSSERPLGGGIINFFSGIAHIPAFLLPSMVYLTESSNIAGQSLINLFFPCINMLIFFFMTIDKPESIELSPYVEDDPVIASRERYVKEELLEKKRSVILFFMKDYKFWLWCGVAFFSSICRYGLLEWIPPYFEKTGLFSRINEENFSNILLPMGMAFGTLVITYIAGKKFAKNKGVVVAICSALTGTMISLFPVMPSLNVVLLGIFCSGFFLYGINGIIWIYAMDRGGRYSAATLAGILNAFAYIGAFVQVILFSGVLKWFENEIFVFLMMAFICFIMIGLMILASERDTIVEKVEE